jgi:ribA/ribD-fused uncharacterized protein
MMQVFFEVSLGCQDLALNHVYRWPMIKTNKISDCVVFSKTKESFGGFSNMSPEFPITVGSLEFPTSEHFYQSMKYVDHPSVQREIFGEKNPMLMKNKQKKHRGLIRKDWEDLKEVIMEITVHLKLVSHWVKFGNLLIESGEKEIVEISKKDSFWGMIPQVSNNGILVGENKLGGILVRFRDLIRTEGTRSELVNWNPDHQFRILFNGEFMEGVNVLEKVQVVGNRSFDYLIKKGASPYPQFALAA